VLFNNLKSNKKNHDALVTGVNNKTIPHAQLFYGPPKTKKLYTALAYIQYIFCLNKNSKDSCGVCSNCVKNQLLIHPDVHFVIPVCSSPKNQKPVSTDYLEIWKKEVLNNHSFSIENWTDVISNGKKNLSIYVQEIQEIEKKINIKSYQGDFKVVLIWNANKLNIQASNKLLKNLEEPPNKTLFILISESKQDLISTIYSRLLPIKFIEEEATNNLLIDEEKDTSFSNWFVEWVRLCFQANKKNKISELIDLTEKIASMNRNRQIQFLNYVIENFRKTFLYSYNLGEKIPLEISHENFSIKNFSVFVHSENIFLIFKQLEKSIYLINRNANSKLLFLDLSLILSKLIYKKNKI